MNAIDKYLYQFSKLKRASLHGARAPHKPILLLSVVQLMDEGLINDNRIYITAELVARFKDNWNLYVDNHGFRPNFYLPFFHLRSDKFWHLKTYFGKEIVLTGSASIGSFAQLKEVIEYAYLDGELFNLLCIAENRQVVMHYLLAHYFVPDKTGAKAAGILDEIEKQILHDSPAAYRQHVAVADEEDIFIRGAVFKKEIPRIYNSTCCITGMQIITGYNIQMVDACHIVPFAISHDDTISNGISLSPNLHRAFDRGLITVDENYKVKVSDHFTEPDYAGNLRSFAGMPILLPGDKLFLPAVSNFTWHFSNIFKQ